MAEWEVAHKQRGDHDGIRIKIEAPTPWDAVTVVREQLDDQRIIAFVRRLD